MGNQEKVCVFPVPLQIPGKNRCVFEWRAANSDGQYFATSGSCKNQSCSLIKNSVTSTTAGIPRAYVAETILRKHAVKKQTERRNDMIRNSKSEYATLWLGDLYSEHSMYYENVTFTVTDSIRNYKMHSSFQNNNLITTGATFLNSLMHTPHHCLHCCTRSYRQRNTPWPNGKMSTQAPTPWFLSTNG